MSKGNVITLVIIGCLLLAVANVALWATLDVFNPSRFGESVAEGLQSPEATAAMAGPIVDQLLAEYPDMPPLVRGAAEEIVALLLQRPLFTPVIKGTAAMASMAMTTSAEDVIGIDLGGIASNMGDTLVGAISSLDEEAGAKAQTALDNAQTAADEKGRLAIYEEGRFPKLRQLSNISPWLALIAGLGAIALFVVAAMQAQDRHAVLKYTGVGIMVTAGLTFLLFAPVLQAVAQNNIANPIMQIVVGQVVSALMRRFAIQSLLLLFIGGGVLVFNHTQARQDEPAPAAASPAA
jgi:hypothetical protein